MIFSSILTLLKINLVLFYVLGFGLKNIYFLFEFKHTHFLFYFSRRLFAINNTLYKFPVSDFQ